MVCSLALVWTAGFVPTFLEPAAASVLFAKPLARWHLLMGKYLGVMTFVAVQVSLFILLTWAGIGHSNARLDVDLLVVDSPADGTVREFLQFFHSRRGDGAQHGRLHLRRGVVLVSRVGGELRRCHGVRPPSGGISLPFRCGSHAGSVRFFPKPIDAGLIFFNVLDATHHFQKPHIFQLLESETIFSTTLSLITSLFFSVIFLGVSALQLEATDY